MSGVLGAVIAGGRSERYGSPKALATVGGIPIIERVTAALRAVVTDIVLIANDPVLAETVPLSSRGDAVPGIGALGGIHAALLWARERASTGILAVACDMPFVSPALLECLLERARAADAPDLVAPESGGPRRIEPLCAFYRDTCLDAIERAIARSDRRMIGFHGEVRVATLPREEVERYGDPDVLFLNVNTPEDRDAAQRLAAKSDR
jgi:molybdopterin-guanine dinucleotide biosynthesis protein A